MPGVPGLNHQFFENEKITACRKALMEEVFLVAVMKQMVFPDFELP